MNTNKITNGYAKGVRLGHASAHLIDPLCEALELEYHGECWWTYFGSKEKALTHIRKLWHCTDIMSNSYGVILEEWDEKFGKGGSTYAQAVRVLRQDLI